MAYEAKLQKMRAIPNGCSVLLYGKAVVAYEAKLQKMRAIHNWSLRWPLGTGLWLMKQSYKK